MSSLQDGYPGLTVFLSFGHSLPWVLSERGRRPLSETSYGLLAPFVDGMLEAARGRTRVVDGYELSYGFVDCGSSTMRKLVEASGPSGVPGPYRERCSRTASGSLDERH
jgi:hypothetical protein